MLLRTKIALVVTTVVAAYAGLDHAAQRMVVTPRFQALERQAAIQDLERVRLALEGDLLGLDARCSEWANWKELARFVEASRQAHAMPQQLERDRFIDANLGVDSFRRSRLHMVYVVDVDGRIHWGKLRDVEDGTELVLRDLAFDSLSPSHPFLVKARPDGSAPEPVKGIVATELGTMFVAARPIASSDGASNFIGTVILGRRVDANLVEGLTARTGVQFQAWSLTGGTLPPEEGALLDSVTGSGEPVLRAIDADRLAVYTTIADEQKRPALLVRADIAREISKEGATAVNYSLVSTAAAGFLLLTVLLIVLRRTVLAPIQRLTHQAVEIGLTEDYSAKLDLRRDDEIGILAGEFDSMMAKLEKSRAAVVSAARSAGMAEMATGVLHNVGNVLNSVNVSAGLVAEKVKGSKLQKLERVVEMVHAQGDRLGEFIAKDPKGRHVAPFLGEVTRLMRVEQEEITREVEALSSGIEHIRRLVASQQEVAGSSNLKEAVLVEEQVRHALTLCSLQGSAAGSLTVETDIGPRERLMLDRHKLVMILVNLLKNARESIELERPSVGRIVVRARLESGKLSIAVEDNGVGIPAGNLDRIFHHGFTTKSDGHGFGLHASANAARELEGRLSAASPGEHRGAVFTLELPCEPARRA